MPRNRIRPPTSRRRAAILLVVVVLLMLFLVIGICFVLFAEAQATSSRFYREAANNDDKFATPEELLGWSLGKLIYDEPDHDPVNNPPSAICGHSLARNMYGWNYAVGPGNSIIPGQNEVPYNGAGRPSTAGPTAMNPFNEDDRNLISYQFHAQDGGFYRRPDATATGCSPAVGMSPTPLPI